MNYYKVRLMDEMCLDIDLQKVCRICLSQTNLNELLTNIFTDAIVDGMLVALPEVIEYCVEIQVQNGQMMPNKICQSCKSLMYQFYVFKQRCHRTDNLLRSMLQQGESSTDSPSVHGKSMDETGDEKMLGPTLGQLFQNKADSVADVSPPSGVFISCIEETIEEEVVAVMIASDNDNSVHASSDSLLRDEHLQEGFPQNEQYEEDYASDVYEEVFNQPALSEHPSADCDPIKSEKIVITRLKTDGSNRHTCEICGKVTASRSRLMKHMKLHTDSNIVLDHMNFFSCTSCHHVFLREEDLNEHIATQHCIASPEDGADKRVEDNSMVASKGHIAGGICGICDRKYEGLVRLKQHIITHLDRFPCPVEGCGCEYASLARLSIHVGNQHVEYLSPNCPHCNETIERVDLRQHVRLFCKAKQFGCTHCDKKFLSSKALSQHLKKLEQTFPCSQCDKILTSQASLRLHERTHTGERPYVCTICHKSYKTSSLRTAHMDTHIDGKTFKCSMCGKCLQTRACYRNHVKRHLEERNHECFICGKKFFQKCTLRVHLKMVHRISRVPEVQ